MLNPVPVQGFGPPKNVFQELSYATRQKNGQFTVRLTVSIYPPHPLRSAFCDFLCVFFILDYDSMCSERDFTQEKSHFQTTSSLPKSSLLFAAAKLSNSSIAEVSFVTFHPTFGE